MTTVDEARAVTKQVARTFSWACRMLPRAVRDDVYLLYFAFRSLDDLVDDRRREAATRVEAVDAWARGEASRATPEVAIFEDLATRHSLPRDAIGEFCTGMRHDLVGEPLETEAAVDRYCYRVAGTVGIVMAEVLGMHDPRLARPAAAALGMAMQRTNILRDIDEDLRAGRIYVALESIERLGGLAPGNREALLRDQISRAERLYERGLAGVPLLQCGNRAIAAAAAMYREILREIERSGWGVTAGRAAVSRPRKLVVAAQACVGPRFRPPRPLPVQPTGEAIG